MEPKLTPPDTLSPGAMLRQARTERGQSLDEVAQALRLSPRILSALEDDAYERLPGPTYVRGYLRSYAQFLGLSVRPLLEGFNNRPEAKRRTEIKGRAPVRQATASDAVVRLASVAVAVVVFGLAAMWWTGHDISSVSGDAEPLLSEPVFEPAPEPAPEYGISDPVATAQAPAVETAAPPPAEEPANAAESPPPVETPVQVAADVAPDPVETARSAEPEPAAAPTADETPAAPVARLVLYLHEDSWADVRDARGERLLYETIPAGRVVTVEGVAPLSVFLGNVRGVTVEFNGEEYNAARHRRGDVARFTLGTRSG